MSEIKEIIKDFVNFDIEKNYYQKEDKEELVRRFKKIVYEDETTIRKFLKALFEASKKLASEYSLITADKEIEEIPAELPEPPIEGEIKVPEDAETTAETPAPTEESICRKIASDLLYE